MGAIADAAVEIETALETLEWAAVYRDPGATINTPGIVLGPPALLWEAGCPGPTSARFLVYVIVDADERAVERLWEYVAEVADTIDEKTGVVVIRADPATYVAGSPATQLPAYEIQVEASL